MVSRRNFYLQQENVNDPIRNYANCPAAITQTVCVYIYTYIREVNKKKKKTVVVMTLFVFSSISSNYEAVILTSLRRSERYSTLYTYRCVYVYTLNSTRATKRKVRRGWRPSITPCCAVVPKRA